MQWFLQNETTAQRRKVAVMALDENDGFTEETGLSVANLKTNSRVIKADGTAAAADGTFVEIENGLYSYEFTAAELDQLGIILLRVRDAATPNMKTFYFQGMVVLDDPYTP